MAGGTKRILYVGPSEGMYVGPSEGMKVRLIESG